MASMKKYKRRRYGEDVVIYTTERGHFKTVKAEDFKDPWKVAGDIINGLNKQQ